LYIHVFLNFIHTVNLGCLHGQKEHHRLRDSTSPALTATGLVNGNGKF